MDNQEFTDEQKQYLQGFLCGTDTARARMGLAPLNPVSLNGHSLANGSAPVLESPSYFPESIHHRAQDRTIREGKKLVPEETAKRERHPLDAWDSMQQHADDARFPKGTDVLAWKYHGLFYVAPAQDSYMCRLRFHGGLVRSEQMKRLAEIAEQYGGGYTDATTRANLQIREIRAENATNMLMALQDAGICSRGSGADNIRNVTGTPTAGIDAQELIDVRPLCRDMHYYILNHREMYGLPRKFNIAFDGGGTISALEDTNDIGFSAVRVPEGAPVPAGVYFRMLLGGITGHLDFARDTGLLLTPEQCVPAAAAVVKVFIEHGDRTDRKKARLKYLLDKWGMEKFVQETRGQMNFEPLRLSLEHCEPRGPVGKHLHVGIHPQRQEGLFYVGVGLNVGRMTCGQMSGVAEIAERYGSGLIRLTVWQNLLISDVKEADLPEVQRRIEELGLHWDTNNIRGGVIACTGNTGCRFAATNTKAHGREIIAYLEEHYALDQPINIHLTGCPHSCAQHYIGDIGMLGAKVEEGDDFIEGYHIFVGGGYGAEQQVARELFRNITAIEAPRVVGEMIAAYQGNRLNAEETFAQFASRLEIDQLKALCGSTEAVA